MNMRNTDEQIKISSDAICKLLDKFEVDERGCLSQNILDKLRTFVEAVAVKASGENEYSYDIFQKKARFYISARADLQFLRKFHKFLQQTISHYLPDEEKSERLMLKYYEYLLKIKSFLKKEYNLDVLENINKFPLKNDLALQEYYEKIVEKINEPTLKREKSAYKERYYIRKTKPFFVNNEVYYEITFTTAIDDSSKFDRVIAFTKFDILSNYAVRLIVSNDVIEVFGKKMPIQIIDNWKVSIRPCELNHFADIFGNHSKISDRSTESSELMMLLTKTGLNLVEIVNFSDEYYQRFKNAVIKGAKEMHFFNVLDKSRELIKRNFPGSNIVRYLLYKLNNKIIKSQYSNNTCKKLSDINFQWGCIPFDDMPFNSSPIGHNPKIFDLIDCMDSTNREHEMLARCIKNNTEQRGQLYTPLKDLASFKDVDGAMSAYNSKLWSGHANRKLEKFKDDYIYIKEYEEDTFRIIEKLKELSTSGIKNYSNSVDAWLQSDSHGVDCDEKKSILRQIFANSRVGMIYGSAGTGKTRLINHISNFYKDESKLYLANTNPAVNNLERRISVGNSKFQTIASFLRNNKNQEFDLLIIDECSTVSNSDMLDVLSKASFKLLVLVGDDYQIESILFGNWFGIAKSFIPETSIFELTKPYRTKNDELLTLWRKVRNIEDNILEHIENNNYSALLDSTIFERSEEDEIILCLNYDGLYGINNINRFLQENNKNNPCQWGIHTYKINDPVLFNESYRFKPLIHNNLKGKILGIKSYNDKIQFDIEIDKSINEINIMGYDGLELLGESRDGKSIIRFFVNVLPGTDEDDDYSNAIVPFQVAYAVSMHKAQGLEYDSVKVVITNETEEMISHNIFYTAITRAKEKLKIYWTPETEKKILGNLEKKFNKRDVDLLKAKFKL
jgi:hypothetical protein